MLFGATVVLIVGVLGITGTVDLPFMDSEDTAVPATVPPTAVAEPPGATATAAAPMQTGSPSASEVPGVSPTPTIANSTVTGPATVEVTETTDSPTTRPTDKPTDRAAASATVTLFPVSPATVMPVVVTTLPPPEITLPPTLPPLPTQTPLPSASPTVTLGPPPTPTPTPTSTSMPTDAPLLATDIPSLFPFIVQPGTPNIRDNFGEQGCDWQGVAGTTVDQRGRPLPDLEVHVIGEDFSEWTAVSGQESFFGPSGWMVTLGDGPARGRYRVSLWADGVQVSRTVNVEFDESCQGNLALVNFVMIRPY